MVRVLAFGLRYYKMFFGFWVRVSGEPDTTTQSLDGQRKGRKDGREEGDKNMQDTEI